MPKMELSETMIALYIFLPSRYVLLTLTQFFSVSVIKINTYRGIYKSISSLYWLVYYQYLPRRHTVQSKTLINI